MKILAQGGWENVTGASLRSGLFRKEAKPTHWGLVDGLKGHVLVCTNQLSEFPRDQSRNQAVDMLLLQCPHIV